MVLATGDSTDCGSAGPMIESASMTTYHVRVDVVHTRLTRCVCPLVSYGRSIVLARRERPARPIEFHVPAVDVPCG